MTLYFVVDSIAYFVGIYIYTAERVSPRSQHHVLPNDRPIDWFHMFVLFFYLLNIPQNILGYSIIYFKDQKDMIQEVNRLEDIKVSVFQKYKVVEDFIDTKSKDSRPRFTTASQKASYKHR